MKKKIKNTRRSRPKGTRRRRPQPLKPRPRYRTRNWSEYNRSLVQRGSLTLWFDEAALTGWFNTQHHGGRGAACTYSDVAIETALLCKAVYSLPLRAAQGLLESVVALLGVDLPVPHYSTVSRRQATLEVSLGQSVSRAQGQGQPLHVVIDSTGCKIYGEGEWKVRQHGYSKRRTWRKLHLGVDEASGEIVAAVVTTNDVADSAVLEDVLEQIEAPIGQVSADGIYDKRVCYEALHDRQVRQGQPLATAIPPRRGARIRQHGNCKATPLARDENIRRVRQVGRAQWKEDSGYHRRSLAETTMFRLKSRFGARLSSRRFESQATEAFIRCAALNRMTQLGMPDSYAV